MSEILNHNETFHQKQQLGKGDYEACVFVDCDFSDNDFSAYKFIDCVFERCNLSLVKIVKAVFQDVKFADCKMLGLRFDLCNPFGFSISASHCILNDASFYQMKLRKLVFENTKLLSVDFAEADLSEAKFINCNLEQTIFERSRLEKADFRTAFNYSIDPEKNFIKKAKFSTSGLAGLLDKFDIIIEN